MFSNRQARSLLKPPPRRQFDRFALKHWAERHAEGYQELLPVRHKAATQATCGLWKARCQGRATLFSRPDDFRAAHCAVERCLRLAA